MEDAELSRRDIFRNVYSRFKDKKEKKVITTEATKLPHESITLDRREALKLFGKLGVALVAPVSTVQMAENKKVNSILPPNTFQGIEDLAEGTEPKVPSDQSNTISEFAKTAIETSLMEAGSVIATKVFDNLGIEHGNKNISEEEVVNMLENFDFKDVIPTAILAPLVEESLFRKLPSETLAKNAGMNWDIGIPTSALFALGHNINQKSMTDIHLEKSVPINEFMGGLFYWYLMRTRGYNHAVFAHSLGNSGRLAVGSLLYQAYPDSEKAQDLAKTLVSG